MNNNRRGIDDGEPRPGLSLEEQIIISERRRKREAQEKKKEQAEMAAVKPVVMDRKTKATLVFASLSAFVVAFGFVSIILQIILFSGGVSDIGNYKVMYGEEVISKQSDGAVYLDMEKVASLCGFKLAGDLTSPKYVARGGDDIQFSYGSKVARVNGQKVLLRRPTKKLDGKLYIPVSVIEDLFRGVKLEGKSGSDLDFEVSGDSISFVAKSNDTFDNTDYGEFKDYDTSKNSEYLLLVNKQSENHLQMDYEPTDLVNIPTKYAPQKKDVTDNVTKPQRLRATALTKLMAMMDAMKKDGHTSTYVTSAYRSYQYQVTLFNTYVQQEMSSGLTLAEAQAKAATYSAVPGTSEHQSGLCIDFYVTGMADLDESFETYPVFDWLQENAWKYGYVLRFPEGRTDITGYTYEPWHYRYVGEYHAAVMHSLDLTLEEYVDYLN